MEELVATPGRSVKPVRDEEAPEIRLAVPSDAAGIAHVHMTSRAVTMPYLPPEGYSRDEVTR
ncbi:hypothetical protein [Streptomyces sp. MST-110588]|uniref:hypothetical protein n=1 Tax=Streptomyces sp. MST-110588 TaxID=2833628 RepID=UPI001F5C8B36|nr:hypothetical protein [Streptomyces sp. MST-110588]